MFRIYRLFSRYSSSNFLCIPVRRKCRKERDNFRHPEVNPIGSAIQVLLFMWINPSGCWKHLAQVQQQWWVRALVLRCVESSKVVQLNKERGLTLHLEDPVKHSCFKCPITMKTLKSPEGAFRSVKVSAPVQGTAGRGAQHLGLGVCVWCRSGWPLGWSQRAGYSVPAHTCHLYIVWTSCA